MSSPSRAPFRPLIWVCALVCTLLLTQMLGLMHGMVHGPQAHVQGTGHAHLDGHAHGRAAVAGKGASWLASLFPSHQNQTDCSLFDQASHGSVAIGIASLNLPMAPALLLVLAFPQGQALARWWVLFSARGPPLAG